MTRSGTSRGPRRGLRPRRPTDLDAITIDVVQVDHQSVDETGPPGEDGPDADGVREPRHPYPTQPGNRGEPDADRAGRPGY
jgi:hypothetical protein